MNKSFYSHHNSEPSFDFPHFNSSDDIRHAKSIEFTLSFEFDKKYWSTPFLSLNLHFPEIEFGFLCFTISISKTQ